MKLINSKTAAALRDYKTLTLGVARARAGDPPSPHRAVQPWRGHAFVAHWGCPEPWRCLSLRQRERLLCLAASSGHAPSLDAALAHCGCALKPEVLTAAAAAGNLAICERLLHGEGCSISNEAVAAAAEGGHMPVLQLLLGLTERKPTPTWLDVAAQGACAGGQPHILEWLQQAHGYSLKPEDAVAAASAGRVALLEGLLLPRLFPAAVALAAAPAPAPAAAAAAGGGAGNVANGAAAADRPRDSGSGDEGDGGNGDNVDRDHRDGRDGGEGGEGGADDDDRAAFGSKWQLLNAIIHGCPVDLLHRYYTSLWRWRPQAAPPPEAAAGGALEAAAAAAARDRDAWFDGLLSSAVGSPTPCWAAKLELLLRAWGPTLAPLVLESAELGRGLRAAAGQLPGPEFLARLQRLREVGVPLGEGGGGAFDGGGSGGGFGGGEFDGGVGGGGVDAAALDAAVWGGHAEALVWLWDECGLGEGLHGGGMAGLLRRLRRRRGRGWGCAAAPPPERCVGVLRVMRERGLEVRAEDVEHVACAYPAYPPRVRQQQYDNHGRYLAGVDDYDDGDNEEDVEEEEEDGEEEDGEEEEEGGEGEGEAGYGRAPCRRTVWSAEDALLWLTEAAVAEAEEDDDVLTVRRRWSRVFSKAAAEGAGLRLLRAIREKRGAAVDLGAVACGGSLEALEWAAAELEAEAEAGGGGPRGGGVGGGGGGGGAARTLKALSRADITRVERAGNLAALAWLRHRGLLLPP